MKKLTAVMIFFFVCASAAQAASVFDDKAIRRNNEQIRQSVERGKKQRELNNIESEMNRLRGSGKPSDMRDMQRYEGRSQELTRDLNKR